jgi:hypothetical protein
VTPFATSESNSGVIGLIANLPFCRRFLRPPSTEAPSLHRSYLGSPAQLVQDMRRDGVTPDSWSAISDYVYDKAKQQMLRKETGYDFVKAIENVDDTIKKGAALTAL